MSIIIFSKPIHSGKTTALMLWCATQKNAGGILMPDADGERKMFDLRSNEFFDAECKDPMNKETQLTGIGRYHFYTTAFEKANSILLNELKRSPDWLVIDEIGKLEMEGSGFYPALNKLIPLYRSSVNKLLLVIRDSLVGPVVSFFEIRNAVIVDTLDQL